MLATLKDLAPSWMKSSAHDLVREYRHATWTKRALPDFIIIGAQKAGTSSLYNYLGQHPQIAPSYTKEVHYFDGGISPSIDTFAKGTKWYASHFPLRRNVSIDTKIFEASPLYLFNPVAAKRMSELLPDVKIIALLRNPTERAISQFFHETRLNREFLSIKAAFETEFSRIQPAIDAKNYKDDDFICHSYQSRGLYKEQLERYSSCFPKEHILLLESESFFSDPRKILKQVFKFVGVDEDYRVKDLKPRNVASNRSKVPLEVYENLNAFFSAHNEALYRFIGETYDW